MNLTACTVSYKSTTEITNNVALANLFNPDCPPKWIIADNSPSDSADTLKNLPGNVEILPGVEPVHTPHFHHTIALNETIQRAHTRFILVIDPDFFIIRPNWIRDMISYMTDRHLAILGVPWHPRRTDKYRYFPAVHCSLFDTERIAKSDIDFRPDYPNGSDDENWPHGYVEDANFFAVNPISTWLAKFEIMKPRRAFYIDTGSRLFKKYVNNSSTNFEIIDPVYSPIDHEATLSFQTRLFERFLPDELCYVPKRYIDNSTQHFTDRYLGEPIPSQWEEFVWQSRPFGFHMRRNAKANERSKQGEINLAVRILEAIRQQRPINMGNSAHRESHG